MTRSTCSTLQRSLALGAVLLAQALAPHAALACTPASCWAGELLPASGTVPANLPGLEWLGLYGGTASVTAARIETAGEVAAGVTLEGNLITFDAPLVEGAVYVVRGAVECTGGGWAAMVESTFLVGAAAPLPSDLGSVAVTNPGIGPISAVTYIGSCSLEVDAARADVVLSHSAAASPWLDALSYETYVDGVRWRPSGSLGGALGPLSGSWVGRGVDQVYAICGGEYVECVEPEDIAEGSHLVEMRARVAGSTHEVTSASASFTLDCTPNGGGCSVARGASPPSTALGASLVVAALHLARNTSRRTERRRRDRASPRPERLAR